VQRLSPEQRDDLLAGIRTDDPALRAMLDNLSRQAQAAMAELSGVEGEVPAPPDEPVTRLGDLWVLGDPHNPHHFDTGHRLLCGDAGIEADVNRLLDDGKGGVLPIHCCPCDPPYNVRVEPRSNNAIASGLSSFTATQGKAFSGDQQSADLHRYPIKAKGTTKKMRAKDRPLANDFVSDEAFAEMLLAWFGSIARVLQPGRTFYIWGGYANVANYPPALKATGLYFSQTIIWDKEHPVLTRKDFMGAHEWCFYGWKEGAAHVYLGPNNIPDLWHIKKINPQSMVHLTEKPVELAVRAMNYSSRPDEHVTWRGPGRLHLAARGSGRYRLRPP
jgi:DNA modification methylase